MFCQASFDQGLTTIMQPLSPLSKPQATVLALGRFGMVLARSCALTAGSHLLAKGMTRQAQTVRQPRRAWDDDTPRTRGPKRQARHVEPCFAPRLGWGVSWGQGTPVARAIDATPLGPRFVGLAVSVGSRGGAMPVAWGILPAGPTPAWRREGLWLLRRLHRAIPRGGQCSARRGNGLVALPPLGPTARHALAWHGQRLYPHPDALPPPRALGRGRQGPLADPDRSGAGGE